ncbi:MAG: cyclase family protein [Candidatus Hodarchaeota archaeon]
MTRVIDCSMVISNRVWRGGWKVNISTQREDVVEIEGVKVRAQSSIIHMSAHCGTHIDSPWHFIEGEGPIIGEIPIDRCFGEAAVVDLTDKGELEPITAEDMEKRGKHVREGDIVLLKTGWMERNADGNTERMEGLPANLDFWKRGPYPSRSMAEWMVHKKVRAVGYDCPNEISQGPSVENAQTRMGSSTPREEQHVHRIHLSNGIMQIEYLCNLTAIKKERVKFFAVPLKLKTEGSPVRAFAIEE